MRDKVQYVLVLVLVALCLTACSLFAEEDQNPEAVEHYNAGVEFTRAGDYEKAVAEFKKSLEIDPDNVQTIYGLGLALRLWERLEESIQYLNQAIELNPLYVEAYWDLGKVYWAQKEYELAINQFLTITNFGPEAGSKYPKAYYSLGRLYLLQENLAQALEALQMAVAFDPEYAEALYYTGEIYRKQKDLTAAIDFYRQAAALDSTDMQTFYRLGLVYKEDGQYEQAIGSFQRVIQSSSSLAKDSRYRLALVYNSMGRYEDAIAVANEYLELKPGNANALMVVGEAHEKLGQYEQAIEAYTAAASDSKWAQFANYKIDELKKYTE